LAVETSGMTIVTPLIDIPPPPFVLSVLPTARKRVQTKRFDRERFCLHSIRM